MHLVLLVLGMVILMLPISLFGAESAPSPDPNGPSVIGVLASLYSAIQMVGFEMSLSDWMGAQALHDVGGVLGAASGITSPVPMHAQHVRNADVLSSISEFAKDTPSYSLWKMGFPLYTFGSLSELFSYETIAKDVNEQRAMRANGAYGSVRYGEDTDSYHCEIGYNGLTEFKKMSNRAFVHSIRYKLWMRGLDESCGQDRYTRALGISGNEQSELATVACKVGYYDLPKKTSAQEGGISSDDYASFKEYEERMRAQLPTLCYLADLEHVRWTAFHRALGWKDPMEFVDTRDASRIEAYIRFMRTIGVPGNNKHAGLKLHTFLCDSIDELRERGEWCEEDPHSYDRMMIREGLNIL